MTNYVWVTTQKEMLHSYPKAPEEVKFLRNIHRHLFKFKVYLQVYNDSRDVEFILFKRNVDSYLNELNKCLGTKSCEMICRMLAGYIRLDYSDRDIKIEVSEDGENGSEYFFPKSQSLNND